MVIPHRDWLLLRGRMRAVAKIADLPLLLIISGSESDEPNGDAIESRKEKRDG
jgi:hypothetical protein